MSSKCHQSPHTTGQEDYNFNLNNTYLGLSCGWGSACLKKIIVIKVPEPKKINTESAYSIQGTLIEKNGSFWNEGFGLGFRERRGE